MIIRLTTVTLLSLLMATGLFAQQPEKIGTTTFPLLEVSPSVRGIGMGQTAVTSSDSRSFYFNPGTLALMDLKRGALSFNPTSTNLFSLGDFSSDMHSEASTIRLMNKPWGNGSFALAFGYMHTVFTSGPIQEITFVGPGRVFNFSDHFHSFSIAGAYKGSFELGLGTTVRYIREDVLGTSIDGFGFDIGTMLRIPLVGSLSNHNSIGSRTRLIVRGGFAVTNFGAGLSFDPGAPPPPGTRSFGPSQVPLPRRGRFGLGLDFENEWFSLSPVMELTVASNNGQGDLRLGLEAGLFNILFARAGRVDENDSGGKVGFSETSYGFGFSTKGIRELATRDTDDKSNDSQNWLKYLGQNLNLTFSFAHVDSDFSRFFGFDDPNYYQIEITL